MMLSTNLLEAVIDRLSGSNLAALGLLFATCIIASVAMFLRAHPGPYDVRSWFRYAFPRHILTHRSARADALFWITRKMLMPLLLLPTAAAVTGFVGYGVYAVLDALLGGGFHAEEPAGPWTVVLFTISALLAYDLSYYLYHRAQHRAPMLWELHKVHHSAEVMVGITKDRIHPLDEVMNRAWDGIVVGTVYGVWLLFAVDPVEAAIFGINVYVLRNILMMDLLRHTHLKVSFGPLNHLVLCPHWHQLHHSADSKHFDRNFGLMLSVWDRLFGTQAVPVHDESFTFGLGPRESLRYQSLYGLYVLPLTRMAEATLRQLRTRRLTFQKSVIPDEAGLRIELINAWPRCAAVALAWQDLERRADADLFRSHAWIAAWWRAGPKPDFSLRIATAWRGEALVGVLPLVLRRHQGVRVLEWAAKDCTDYCDVLLAPDVEATAVLGRMWKAVRQEGGYDMAYLSHVLPHSAAAALAGHPGGIEMRPGRRQAAATGVTLAGYASPHAFFQSLGKKGRNNHLRGLRILEEAGPVSFRLAEAEETRALVQKLFAMKQALLNPGEAATILSDDGTLLNAMVQAAAERGILRLFVLEAGGRLAAGLICFAEGTRLAAYLTTYDVAFARASPGSVILVEAVQWAIANNFGTVDFLCGDEAYKRRLADCTQSLGSLVAARTPLGLAALLADRFSPLAVQIRNLRKNGRAESASPQLLQPRKNHPVTTVAKAEA
ncbi:GNAT family N-acetyltransferase [Roseomonas sp. E05]|uniref:GNAT family N-acetyltransferase n=1 Tax=Roseomonas sp. E05 TaxID=3046310 RepID=UPI0024B9CE9B|nr:GNAT family N-acetyltransferase [Roseomonas sp. E05]MDJ0390004.1 GNAT family N-acetyltransferase [Roseomonas sp. E05]